MRLAKGKRALVIGGSMSGLLAALALRQHGWHVDVYERVAEPLAGRGAGIVAQPELKAILRKLGLQADRDLGIEVASRVMFARDGRVTHRVPIAQTMTAWDRVFFLLKAALPEASYHRGKELRHVEQRGQGVVAHFAPGCRKGAGAAVQRDGRPMCPAVPAADLRSRSAAHGVWPRGNPRRCGIRGAPACRRGCCQGC